MIVLLGASGYIGQAFARVLQEQNRAFVPLSRARLDYTRFDLLLEFLRKNRPALVVNAAGYTGRPNVDACEEARAETLAGNTLLPQTIAHACQAAGVTWGHVSSGCIFSGAKIRDGDRVRIETDLTKPAVAARIAAAPDCVLGFTESDEPNFTFRRPPCSFYSGTKALAEEAIRELGPGYIWRLRIPFDAGDHPRNYLTKLQTYPKVYDNVNSISHRHDFVRACLELFERGAPPGIYNVTNPGFVTSRQVTDAIRRILAPDRQFEFWSGDEEFYRVAARAPRSNCVLDVSKVLGTGVRMRPVTEAIEDSLRHWRSE